MDMKQMQEMMTRAQEMQQQMQQKMRETQVEASAGGGAVVVRMNGEKQVLSIKIEKDAASDVEMLQDLVTGGGERSRAQGRCSRAIATGRIAGRNGAAAGTVLTDG